MEENGPAWNQALQEQYMNKNRLQELTQKTGIPLPVYHTVNEGFEHAPRFRSSVVVDGKTFTSPNAFIHKKEAEQDAAKLALGSISKKIVNEGLPSIYEEVTFCKSMLHEYAVKMSLEKPTYQTSQAAGGINPRFISSSTLNGQTYAGDPARNKKEAEQMAARAAIKSILANSNSQGPMREIIRSKEKLYAAFFNGNSSGLSSESIVPSISHSQNNSNYMFGEEEALANSNKDEQIAKATATETFTPEPKKYEEEYTCELNNGNSSSQQTPSQTVHSAAITSSKTTDEQIGSSFGPENSLGVAHASGMKRTDAPESEGNEPKRSRNMEQALIPPANPEHLPKDA